MVRHLRAPTKGSLGLDPRRPAACAGDATRPISSRRDHRARHRIPAALGARRPSRRLGAWFVELVVGHHAALGRGRHHRASRASSPTTRSWRRCRSCFVLVSIVGLVAEPDAFDEFLAARRRQRHPGGAARAAALGARVGDRATPARPPSSWPSACSPPSTCRPTSWAPWWAASTASRGVPHRPWVRGKLAALVIAIATSVLVRGHDARPDRRLAPGGRRWPSRSSARARPTSPGASST